MRKQSHTGLVAFLRMLFPEFRKQFCAFVLAGSVAGLFLVATRGVNAQTAPDRAQIDTLLRGLNRGRGVGQVAVSPDGAQLAWIEGGRGGGSILAAPIGDLTKSHRVTAGKPDQHCSESEIAWAPDSKALAFFSDCAGADGQRDLYLASPDGSPAKQLTALKGYVHQPAFSPDGTKVAFLYVEGATRPAGALAAMKPWSGVIGHDAIEVQRVAYAAADATEPAQATFISPANLHAYEFNWAPDSKGVAYIAADPPGEDNWWVAKLYTQTLGGEPQGDPCSGDRQRPTARPPDRCAALVP